MAGAVTVGTPAPRCPGHSASCSPVPNCHSASSSTRWAATALHSALRSPVVFWPTTTRIELPLLCTSPLGFGSGLHPDYTAIAMCPSSRALSHSFDKLPRLPYCCSRSQIWSTIFWGWAADVLQLLPRARVGILTHHAQGTLPTGCKWLLCPVFPVPMLLQHPALRVQVTSTPIKLQPLFHGRSSHSCTYNTGSNVSVLPGQRCFGRSVCT